jgi:hypothetical protein
VAGYITLTFATPFVYTGGSLEVGVNWDCSIFAGSPATGGFAWRKDPLANQCFGGSNSIASVTMSSLSNRPQTQMTFTAPQPCTVAPTTVTATAAPATALCPGAAVSLSGSASPVAGGYTYQWQESSNGTSWTDIAGATDVSYSTVPSASTYYRLNADCAAVSGTPTSSASTAQVSVAAPVSTFPYLEGFNTVGATPPGCWTTTSSGTLKWDFVSGVGQFNGPTTTGAGAGYARADYYNMQTAGNPYILQSPSFTIPSNDHRVLFKYWIGSASGATDHLFLEASSNGGSTWTTLKAYQQDPATTATTSPWKDDAVVLTGYNNQTIMLRFRAISNWGGGMCNVGIDEFMIDAVPQLPPTCSAITAPLNGATDICWNSASTITWASNIYQ